MKEKVILISAFIFFAVSSFFSSYGDKVYLRNGRSIEGIVENEDKSSLTLNIGAGSITLPKNEIEKIERYNQEKQTELKYEWSDRYFLNPDFIPSGLEGLADKYRRLEQAHQKAVENVEHRRRKKELIERKENKLNECKKQLARISKRITRMEPRENVKEYNELVKESNILSSKIRLETYNKEKLVEELKVLRKDTSDYINYYSSMKKEIEAEKYRDLARQDQDKKHFISHLRQELAQLNSEFQSHSVDYDKSAGNIIVKTVINDSLPVSLVVDTGASLVVLSQSVVEKMGLKTEKQSSLRVIVADGRRVNAKHIILDSVRVGGAEVKNVSAAVLKNPGVRHADGLLGMSFLRNFSLSIDGQGKELVLEKFNP